MRILVNGVQLFFDVDGASRVARPCGRSRHWSLQGGPGFDHSI
jgi:hypothetical protein